MKFIIPTYLRVGSTWVSHALKSLLTYAGEIAFVVYPEHCLGIKANDTELDLFRLSESDIVKTHSFLPVDLMGLLNEQDVYIVCCRRNFYDTLVSRVLYERYVRTAQGLALNPVIANLVSVYPSIPDDAFINLLIDTHPLWVEKEIKIWRMFDHVITHERVITLSYDRLNGDTESLVYALNRYVRAPASVVSSTITEASFTSMQSKYDTGFIREGIIGGHKRYLDQESIQWIKNKLSIIVTKKLSEL